LSASRSALTSEVVTISTRSAGRDGSVEAVFDAGRRVDQHIVGDVDELLADFASSAPA
jgi:hypothetical protein